ncbi:uncharacterized protein CCOS01_11710 [Colletotrichum costaricense]|uniref:Uncharacterized protein n=1 Tax=Colletotrichum costaricense TaxID=1209916 RepID=A0AAI9YPJ3_9PEZI|nr:uncharacterized protein CCOS01_11710 [Colletotrichum costaricense]KAK1518890.1 hypothetical protein CCOS01_11710 [Colletotrichum costaricense]
MPKPTTVKITVWYCVTQLLLWPAQLQDRCLLSLLLPPEVLWVHDNDDQDSGWSINNEPFLDGTRHITTCLTWPGLTPMTGALDDTSFNFTATSRNGDYHRQETFRQQEGEKVPLQGTRGRTYI